MLKIKDNIDLKELEKFGFKYNDALWSQNYLCPGMVIRKDKIIELTLLGMGTDNQPGANKLYDLIKADLVEKVGE